MSQSNLPDYFRPFVASGDCVRALALWLEARHRDVTEKLRCTAVTALSDESHRPAALQNLGRQKELEAMLRELNQFIEMKM